MAKTPTPTTIRGSDGSVTTLSKNTGTPGLYSGSTTQNGTVSPYSYSTEAKKGISGTATAPVTPAASNAPTSLVGAPNTSQTPVVPTTPPVSAPTAPDTQSPLQNDLNDEEAQRKSNANELMVQSKKFQDTITNIMNGAVPLNDGQVAQINGLKQSYQALINTQTQVNTGATGLANIRGYQTGAAEYDPTFQAKTIGAIVTAGVNKVADLNTKMASAVADLTSSFEKDDAALVKESYDAYTEAATKRDEALDKTVKDTQDAIKSAQDAQQKIQDNINTITEKAAENGADAKTLSAISSATNTTDAIGAAGIYLQSASGQLGDYLQYKRDTTQKGLVPSDYATWKTEDDAKQAKLKASEAYSSAYGSEAGKAAADDALGIGGSTATNDVGDHVGGITQATGLSLQAFNYLTQGTGSLSRLSATQRNQIIGEANNFLNKNGIDVSTFQSQYKAYNDVLQKNVERANNTKVFGDEISGTVDQFVKDIGNDFTFIKPANVVSLFAGKQVNNPTVQKYSFDLKTMQNDLAGYYAASRGASQPDDSDLTAASDVIVNGINGGSATAFQQAINENEKKVTGVVNTAVNSAQKSVWDMFGVGSQYQPKAPQVDPKQGVDEYVQTNPSVADAISNLYKVPGATDQDVWDYINSYMNK